jgi:AcrR family transcriptional regulator
MIIVQFVQSKNSCVTVTEGKREAILRAGGTLLLKHGLRGTSMEAVAREAGMAKPTLYAHFPNKLAVLAAVAAGLIAAWRQDFLAALHGDGDIVSRAGAALIAKHRATMLLLQGSPHAAELYDAHHRLLGPQLRAHEAELQSALEIELATAGVSRPRLLSQLLFAASMGVGQTATSPSELGPALRLLAERLIRPELS